MNAMTTHQELNAVTPSGVVVADGKIHRTEREPLKCKISGATVDGKKSFTLKVGEPLEYSAAKDDEPIVITVAEKLEGDAKTAVENATAAAKTAVGETETPESVDPAAVETKDAGEPEKAPKS